MLLLKINQHKKRTILPSPIIKEDFQKKKLKDLSKKLKNIKMKMKLLEKRLKPKIN